jgi:two-component system response regulator (stage 0 sporulation protein A)
METKARILIADSNQDFCRLISEAFSHEGDLEVVGTAADGVEALSLITELRPDLLLMDLVLPKMDGLELLSRLPETGVGCSVIVLSGFVNS